MAESLIVERVLMSKLICSPNAIINEGGINVNPTKIKMAKRQLNNLFSFSKIINLPEF